VYSTSVVIRRVIISVWFHELGDFVVAFKCNFYFSVPEEVCNFPDLWGYTKEFYYCLSILKNNGMSYKINK